MAFTGPAEDRLAIRELIATYGNAVTQRDGPAWRALWAEDGVWSIPAMPGMEKIEGRDAIYAAWTEAMALFPFQVMLAVPGETEINGDQARGITYNSEINTDLKGVTQRWTGQYTDLYVKRDGTWLFKSRSYRVLHIGPPEAPSSYEG